MHQDGLVHAFLLDGEGGGRRLDWSGVRQWTPDQGILWVHLDYTVETACDWLLNDSELEAVTIDALLSQETRPRSLTRHNSTLISLRGVNLNPGSEPEDMVSIRIWCDANRIISTRKRKLLSISDLVHDLEEGVGPKNAGDFVVEVTSRLTTRMSGVVEALEERLATLEEQVIGNMEEQLRNELADIRRQTIMLRRYLSPQRDAMSKLTNDQAAWLQSDDRLRLREISDQLLRCIEDLDSIKDRAAITHEELVSQHAEQLNSRMYVLSIVAALFLPLGFFTGLLGVNVGGIPGAESRWGFPVFIALLLIIVVFQIVYFKKNKWF